MTVAYTRHVVVYRRQGALAVHVHVDPSDGMREGQVYDATMILPAQGTIHATPRNVGRWRPHRVVGVARGTASTLGFGLEQMLEDHCAMTHVCGVRVKIYSKSDPEDATEYVLPVEIEHRETAL